MGSPPLVLHAEDDLTLACVGLEPDGAAAVAESILDEIPERLLQARAVGVEHETRRHRHLDRPVAAPEAGRDRREQVGDVDTCAPERRPVLPLAREHEQVLGEANEPFHLGRRAQRGDELLEGRGCRSASSSSARSVASGVRSS